MAPDLTVLELDAAPHVARVHAPWQRHRSRRGLPHPVDEDRLQMATGLLLLSLRQRGGCVSRGADGSTERLENGDKDILVGAVRRAVTTLI